MTAQPRLLFVAKPQREVRSAMEQAVAALGLDRQLGPALFISDNWHQSLSDRYFVEPGLREKLLRAGARVSACRFSMILNRINSQGNSGAGIHWAFRARGMPEGLKQLQSAIQLALRLEGLKQEQNPTAHLTISYRAPSRLASQLITPIEWVIDEILLVEGGGAPYHYREIERWPLLPPQYEQLRLFQ